jgi:hypothetical protein
MHRAGQRLSQAPHLEQYAYGSSYFRSVTGNSHEVTMLPMRPAAPFSVMRFLETPKVPKPQTYPVCLSDQLLAYWPSIRILGSLIGAIAEYPSFFSKPQTHSQSALSASCPSQRPWSHSSAGCPGAAFAPLTRSVNGTKKDSTDFALGSQSVGSMYSG